jgi:hypothetical protein
MFLSLLYIIISGLLKIFLLFVHKRKRKKSRRTIQRGKQHLEQSTEQKQTKQNSQHRKLNLYGLCRDVVI